VEGGYREGGQASIEVPWIVFVCEEARSGTCHYTPRHRELRHVAIWVCFSWSGIGAFEY
jgi:hypothetical protein